MKRQQSANAEVSLLIGDGHHAAGCAEWSQYQVAVPLCILNQGKWENVDGWKPEGNAQVV